MDMGRRQKPRIFLSISNMRKFNRKLSLSIDALHHAIEQAQAEQNPIKRLRKLLALKAKLRKLEQKVKV